MAVFGCFWCLYNPISWAENNQKKAKAKEKTKGNHGGKSNDRCDKTKRVFFARKRTPKVPPLGVLCFPEQKHKGVI